MTKQKDSVLKKDRAEFLIREREAINKTKDFYIVKPQNGAKDENIVDSRIIL